MFSPAVSDYKHYIFPYAVWAFPEKGDKPSMIFNAGFLPSSRNLDRFYLCRNIRVDLPKFKPSSENRRVCRKAEGISATLVSRKDFEYTPERREFFKKYADEKFGKNIMSYERLDGLFASPIFSHLLVFTDVNAGREVGVAALYMEEGEMAFYYYAFYDLNYFNRNLGMYMMTAAVELFSHRKLNHLYLGSCYSENALYKTQFQGAEFFNGFCWESDIKQLRYQLGWDKEEHDKHLFETEEFQEKFYGGKLEKMIAKSGFSMKL